MGGFVVNSSSVAKRLLGWRAEATHGFTLRCAHWADGWGRPTIRNGHGTVQVNVTGNGFGYYKAPGDAKFYGANLLSELDRLASISTSDGEYCTTTHPPRCQSGSEGKERT